MSIMTRFRTYKLYSPSARDTLGAVTASTFVKNIDVSISFLTGSIYSNSNNLIISESSHTGIIYDTSVIFAKGNTITDDTFTYIVTFANYADRMTILYLKQVT